MDDAWETEVNGRAPSFQEFLAAEHRERARFLDRYMTSRGIPRTGRNRQTLAAFLDGAGSALAGSPAQTERALDALVRVRPERLLHNRCGGPDGNAA